ncbi:hypothetical protein HFK18_20675|uniref:hypothetical protein n=1 Tax=Stenotrophomonas sp. SbOxS2 TaxID=2723885 RepID=UPI0015D315AB|nr:hypothetical protein [Stenotrophomonas sp. SbOxS2]NYU00883.1 hypothetical protein [Stenotrophomonas sp. SbOxS2]
MKDLQPWGHINSMLNEYGGAKWHCISCASFEVRSAHVPLVLNSQGRSSSNDVLKLTPPSDAGGRGECLAAAERSLKQIQSAKNVKVIESPLLGGMAVALEIVRRASAHQSVVLDISGMPKRFFMFLVLKLMAEPAIKDLLVTYTKPESYPEGVLAKDPEPVAALPGCGRLDAGGAGALMVVGVGYIQFSLAELLEQSKGHGLAFLMPFPPGAPSARRNWTLLHHMDPDVEHNRVIRRVHSMDMFEALSWINEYVDDASGSVDLIPLGPKPHSLAMALAYRKRPERVQVLYAQPHTYRADYSRGIAIGADGEAEAYGYCLKFNGGECF